MNRNRLLTEQFYNWEQRGRGWQVFEEPVQLEPVFVPFFGHYLDSDIIDDGKRPGVLSMLKSALSPKQPIFTTDQPSDAVKAIANDDESPLLTTYSISIPKGYSVKNETIERFLTMLALSKEQVSFEIIAAINTINLQIVCRFSSAFFIYTQLQSYFPECGIQEKQSDDLLDWLEQGLAVSTIDFGLQEEYMRPMAMLRNGHDPYIPLFGIFDQLQQHEAIIVQVLFCGAINAWGESIIRSVSDGVGGSFFTDAPDMPQLAKEKTSQPLFFATMRVAAFAKHDEDAKELLQHSMLALVHASLSNKNTLQPLHTSTYTIAQRLSDILLRQSHRLGVVLNVSELATLVHVPSPQISKKLVTQHRTTKRAPDYVSDQPFVLGINEHQGQEVLVGISIEQRLKHVHIMGATGTGKSTLLHSLIMQDVVAEIGVLCLDPHGDLITELLSNIPASRIKDVVVIDPTDSEFPVGLNILEAHSDVEREVLASDLAAIFKRFSTSFGDQMYSVLSNAILALLFNTRTFHLGDLRKFLIEPSYRNSILSTVTDSDIVYYWQKEYLLLKAGGSIGPVLTRLDSFLRPKVIRAMICQTKSLDFSALMDSGKIILVKLSQGLIGAENSYLLGAFIVAKLQQAAMARQTQSSIDRKPFFCYIDEFHNFVTPSMAIILSGARKYGLGLVLAHQDMQQVKKHDSEVASSVISNAATRICFRLADTDAKRMQEGFGSFTSDDLQNLSTGDTIVRVNTADADFNMTITPYPNSIQEDNTEALIAHSRMLYSVPVQSSVPMDSTNDPLPTPMQPMRPLQSRTKALPEPVAIEPVGTSQAVREHRYTQAFIKKLAEEHGYTAQLEVSTPDGNGQVDVLLEKAGVRIAVELSVTNTAEYELKNIQKCLAAGYERIVCCSANKKKLAQIQTLAANVIAPAHVSKVVFVTVEDFYTVLTVVQQPPKAHATVMKGYRVKVQYGEGSMNQQSLLQSIVNAGRK